MHAGTKPAGSMVCVRPVTWPPLLGQGCCAATDTGTWQAHRVRLEPSGHEQCYKAFAAATSGARTDMLQPLWLNKKTPGCYCTPTPYGVWYDLG